MLQILRSTEPVLVVRVVKQVPKLESCADDDDDDIFTHLSVTDLRSPHDGD